MVICFIVARYCCSFAIGITSLRDRHACNHRYFVTKLRLCRRSYNGFQEAVTLATTTNKCQNSKTVSSISTSNGPQLIMGIAVNGASAVFGIRPEYSHVPPQPYENLPERTISPRLSLISKRGIS